MNRCCTFRPLEYFLRSSFFVLQIPNIQFQQVVRKLDETVNWKKFSREQFRNSADGVERQHMILGIKSTDLTQVILAVSSKFSAFPLPRLSLTFFLLFLFLQRSETRWVAELILPPLQWTLISPDGRLFSTSFISMHISFRAINMSMHIYLISQILHLMRQIHHPNASVWNHTFDCTNSHNQRDLLKIAIPSL